MREFFIILFLITIFFTFVLLYISIYKSNHDNNIYLTGVILHLLFYSTGSLLEIVAYNINHLKVATLVQYLGFPYIPPLFYLFIKKYVNREVKNKFIIALLFTIPVLATILVITNEYTNLYYTSFEIVLDEDLTYGKVEGTNLYIILFVYIYVMYFAALIAVIRAYISANKTSKKNIVFLITAIATSLISGILYMFGIYPFEVDLSPVFILIGYMYMGYHIFIKYTYLSIPYARDNVLEKMRDGYILVDDEENYLDANKVALDIFPNLKDAKVATNIFSYIDLPELETLVDKNLDTTEFHMVEENGVIKDYRITVSSVSKSNSQKIRSWLIYDITDSKLMMADLEYMAKFDPLTNLYNRNNFFTIVEGRLAENIKKRKHFAIIMIDIDFFKKINDTYGHACGDDTIIEVAKRFSTAIRKNDIIARYGGEEFIIYLEDLRKDEVVDIGEKLRTSINKRKFKYTKESFQVTVSIGIAMFDLKKHGSISDVLADADRCLYEAKELGRNKVVIY